MSQTQRIYSREYTTGVVQLHGGWSASGMYVQHLLQKEAESWASGLGVAVQKDSDGVLHVLKVRNHRAVGRCFFIANSPLQIPFGDGWRVVENADGEPGKDIVFAFSHWSNDARLTWKALSQDEIDEMHGNDEFGGWFWPELDFQDGNLPIYLGQKPGDVNAVRLMMTDAFQVEMVAREIQATS